jgi:N4-gp56 family major capsid protein
MAVQVTGGSTAAIQQILQAAFEVGVREQFIYSQSPLAMVPPGGVIARGNNYSSLALDFFHELPVDSSAISETADIVPSTFTISQVTVSAAPYARAVQLSKPLEFQATPDVVGAAGGIVARNAARTIDYLARSQAVSGNTVFFGGDAATRATISPASTSDELAFSNFQDVSAFLDAAPRLPGVGSGVGTGIAGILRKAIVADLMEDGTLILLGERSAPNSFLLNGEIGGHVGGVRIIESNFAKIFSGAGSSLAGNVTSLQSAAAPGSTSLGYSSAGSSDAIGDYLTIGAIESTANGENPIAEVVFRSGGTTGTTAANVVGAGANGGLKYAHAAGEAVTHANQVYASVFMGMDALMKVYAGEWLENGEVLPPEVSGLAKQFNTMAWHWYGGYARKAENRLVRIEHAGSRFSLGD